MTLCKSTSMFTNTDVWGRIPISVSRRKDKKDE